MDKCIHCGKRGQALCDNCEKLLHREGLQYLFPLDRAAQERLSSFCVPKQQAAAQTPAEPEENAQDLADVLRRIQSTIPTERTNTAASPSISSTSERVPTRRTNSQTESRHDEAASRRQSGSANLRRRFSAAGQRISDTASDLSWNLRYKLSDFRQRRRYRRNSSDRSHSSATQRLSLSDMTFKSALTILLWVAAALYPLSFVFHWIQLLRSTYGSYLWETLSYVGFGRLLSQNIPMEQFFVCGIALLLFLDSLSRRLDWTSRVNGRIALSTSGTGLLRINKVLLFCVSALTVVFHILVLFSLFVTFLLLITGDFLISDLNELPYLPFYPYSNFQAVLAVCLCVITISQRRSLILRLSGWCITIGVVMTLVYIFGLY